MSLAWVSGSMDAIRTRVPQAIPHVQKRDAGGDLARQLGAQQPIAHPRREPKRAEAVQTWHRSICGLAAACVATAGHRHDKRRWKRANIVGRRNSAAEESSMVHQGDMKMILRSMEQEVPAVMRFLADDRKLGADYESMEAFVDGEGEFDATAVTGVNNLKTKGICTSVTYTGGVDSDGAHVCLCTCNTNAGLAFGVGVSKKAQKRAKQMAAKQAMERIFHSDSPVEWVRDAHADDGSENKVAQTLEVMEAHLLNISMTVVQPCGTSWKAAMRCALQGRQLLGVSKGLGRPTREEAVAAAGDSFLQQLRAMLRIGKDAAHEPARWAESLEDVQDQVKLELGRLGSDDADVESTLAKLLGGEDTQAKLREALEAATKRQNVRIDAIGEMSAAPPEESDGKIIARRMFEVTKPEDEDWRREEIKGKLPAEKIREDVSKALEFNQKLIVSGGTGSGKSTQLPQFILDDWREWKMEGEVDETLELEVGNVVEVEYEEEWYKCEILEIAEDKKTINARYFDGSEEEEGIEVAKRVRKPKPRWTTTPPRIVVTQPRRIAAIALAQRVAWERFGECGGEVGHAVRGDTILPDSETGTIEYCTVGTLLRRMVADPRLGRYNVVILDEVHERDVMTDFLLNLLREVLLKRPDMRLVLMSATLDVQTFTQYLPGAPVIEVPGSTRYPVEEFHLDHEFFQDFPETTDLLANEKAAREAMGGTGGREYDYSVTSAATKDSKKDLVQSVKGLIEASKKVAKLWKGYAKKSAVKKTDPAKHSEEALRVFMRELESMEDAEEMDGPGEEEDKISNAALLEQIRELIVYNEKARASYADLGKSKLEDWTSHELLNFLQKHQVLPWKAGPASWEVTSSMSWWGTERYDLTFLDLAESVITKILPEMLDAKQPDDNEFGVGAILCFLPGWMEIKELAERLEKKSEGEKMHILRLHSTVSKDEQALIFEPAPEGKVKVILGTNIAESSVTINDVRVVIDAGLHRELAYDTRRRMSTLETVWICQSNAVQRKGRAGRVRAGRVFRLYSREQFEAMPWRPAPEIQRCNLAQVCLQSIALGRDPREFLAAAPDPPPITTVEAAMAELVALDAVQDGIPPRMLPVGQVLSRMPLDPLLGRAMLLGTLFGVPQMTAALLTVSANIPPFNAEPDRIDEMRTIQQDFCSYSDVIASLRALKEFEWVYQEKGEAQARLWADYYMLNFPRLLTLSRVKYRLLVDVRRSGLLNSASFEGTNPDEWGWDGEGDDEWGEDKEDKDDDHEESNEEGNTKSKEEATKAKAAFEDSAGAIFEAESLERGTTLDFEEWMQELKGADREIEDERLLVGILCAAFPTNIAMREKSRSRGHKTASSSKAQIDKRSVNALQGQRPKSTEGEEQPAQSPVQLPEPSWWLYGDMRMSSNRLTLQSTTLLMDWHLALFGGLRERHALGSIQLDGWIGIRADDPKREGLIMRLRQEIRQALVWIAISASWDTVAKAATKRAKALLSILGSAVLHQDLKGEDLKVLEEFEIPALSEVEEIGTLQATEEEREEVEEMLFQKSVAELKVLLQEMNASVDGRKSDLVSRLASVMIYGEGYEEEEWGEEGEEEGEEEAEGDEVEEKEMAEA